MNLEIKNHPLMVGKNVKVGNQQILAKVTNITFDQEDNTYTAVVKIKDMGLYPIEFDHLNENWNLLN